MRLDRSDFLSSEGIADGDYTIIEKVHEPEIGETVLALVDDIKPVIRKYFSENGKTALKTLVTSSDPIYPESIIIQGKVVALIRKF